MNGPEVTWGRPSLPLASMPQRGGAVRVTVRAVNGTADYPIYEWALTLPSLLVRSGKAIDIAIS